MGFNKQIMKPYIQMDQSGLQETFDVPDMVLMPELIYTSKDQNELDEYKLMAGYALSDDAY